MPIEEILNDGLIAAMTIVGEKFTNNEFYVPEMLIAARAMGGAMDLIGPKLIEAGVQPRGTVVLGTVKGDLHDIGKNLVGMMLKGGGFEVIDLGVNIKAEEFLEAIQNSNANILAMSALLTTTMSQQREVIRSLSEKGLRQKIKVMVGGAPVTQQFAEEIGADGTAATAIGAVKLAKSFIEDH